eukprot:4905809-Pyramimonas_sp.AAC.1
MAAHYTLKVQSRFVDAVQIAHDIFQVNRDPFRGHPYSSTAPVTNVRGYALDDGNPTAPSRDRPREGSGVPRARIMLTCALPRMTEILGVAGGAARATTSGNVRTARRTTAMTSLDTH